MFSLRMYRVKVGKVPTQWKTINNLKRNLKDNEWSVKNTVESKKRQKTRKYALQKECNRLLGTVSQA